MDLNYLYHRRQVSVLLADRASCAASRAAHEGLAGLYQSLIDEIRTRNGMEIAGDRRERVEATL